MAEFSPTILSIVSDGNSADLFFGKESCSLSLSPNWFTIDRPRMNVELVCPCVDHSDRQCDHSANVVTLVASLSECIDQETGTSVNLRTRVAKDLSLLDDVRRDIIAFHMELNAGSFTSDTEATLHRQSFIHRLQSLLTKFYTLEARSDPPPTLVWSDHKTHSPTLFSEDIANLSLVRNFIESGTQPGEDKVSHAFTSSLSKILSSTASAYLSLAALLAALGRPSWSRELISRSSAMAREGLADYGLSPILISRLRENLPDELKILIDRKLPFFKKLEISEKSEKIEKPALDSTLAELRALREERINQRVRDRLKSTQNVHAAAPLHGAAPRPQAPVPVHGAAPRPQAPVPVHGASPRPQAASVHAARVYFKPKKEVEIFGDENADWAELEEWERKVRADLEQLE